MKQEASYPDSRDILTALSAAGIDVTAQQARLLAEHARLVLATNATTNLTRITEPDAVIALHIVDSVAFLPIVGALADPVIDIGAGAGYPGVPLSILGHQVDLCESVKKKAAFLQQAVCTLGLDCAVHPVRAEELALESAGAYRTVVARALSSLASLVELAAPLVPVGGKLVALKGTPSLSEEADARSVAPLCGMELVDRREYVLPSGEARSVYVYECTSLPRVHLPRRPGMAQRHPLSETRT